MHSMSKPFGYVTEQASHAEDRSSAGAAAVAANASAEASQARPPPRSQVMALL